MPRVACSPSSSRGLPWLLASLLALSVGCHEPTRSDTPASTAPAATSQPPQPPSQELAPPQALPSDVLDAAAELLCDAYQDWPSLALDEAVATVIDARATALLEPLTPAQRDQLDAAAVVERARAECPGTLVAERVGPRGVPRPAGRVTSLLGTYDAASPASPEEARIALEWTAIGLGCASLRDGADQALYDAEAALLERMDTTLDEYVGASLANADPAFSDRVFAAILACAERAGANVAE